MFRRPCQPEIVIDRIQAGDEPLRNQFIADSVPEIKHWVRRITHSFFIEQGDEFSIALEGFNQAIDRFSGSMNVPFFSYAQMIVKHRLFDWIRRQKIHQRTLTFSDFDTEEGIPLEDQLSDPGSGQICQNLEISESLLQLEIQLELFGLRFSDLTEHFPKHRDTQSFCIKAARHLSGDAVLFTPFMTKHRLPGAELARRCQVPVKTIEKNRSSIILLTLLMRSDLQVIKSYIAAFDKEAGQ